MKTGPRIHLVTLGCAKNLVDSERILGRLAVAGAVIATTPDEADILIVNTCGFIAAAKEESIQAVLRLSQFKQADPRRKLIVMGCLAQRYAPSLRRQLPEVDGIFGLGEEDAILAACGLRLQDREEPGRLLLTPVHTAYLRIADGCDNRCAYCAIPAIRGPFRSRPAEEILKEARELVASGARELNVIGQDTTLYGADRPGSPRIHELLARIARTPRLRWLRLLYTHPAHFTPELIEAYRTLPKLCPYVDLPLQHLNDDILRRMGRRVSQAQVLDLIGRIRERVPGVAIRTSFIVGFPGETRRQFDELLGKARELRFDHLGAFAYSREEGTRAASMPGQLSDRTKARRLGELMRAQQEIVLGRNRAMKGTEFEVVVEEPAPGRRDRWIARSRTQAPDVDGVTFVSGKNLHAGRFVRATVTGSSGYDLIAKCKMKSAK
ncbi:MAG: 30S ribosomal protein S12 methylthiotransferase RimO [Candidatus Brocadiia bacterium]|jgi:ribosomal protein S12 methylthiotransferase